MSLNQHGISEAQPLYQDSGAGAVREIYPGASSAPRIKARPRRRLMGSEAGMATAEYAIATLVAVTVRTPDRAKLCGWQTSCFA